jgi:hypothetical protein
MRGKRLGRPRLPTGHKKGLIAISLAPDVLKALRGRAKQERRPLSRLCEDILSGQVHPVQVPQKQDDPFPLSRGDRYADDPPGFSEPRNAQ